MMGANQMYRLSGSSLPFKEWLENEKAKGVVIPNKPALDAFLNMDAATPATSQTEQGNEKNVRIAKNLFRTAVLLGAAVMIYKLWIKKL